MDKIGKLADLVWRYITGYPIIVVIGNKHRRINRLIDITIWLIVKVYYIVISVF